MFEGLILLVVFLLLWGGHWMRWRVIPFLVNERGDLHRSLAYVYGCACIMAGFVLWVYTQMQTMPCHVFDCVFCRLSDFISCRNLISKNLGN